VSPEEERCQPYTPGDQTDKQFEHKTDKQE